MRKPQIFVSSTCYDLGQVREDLKIFIEGLGYQAILSEHPSFPVHPDKSTIENSRLAVQNNADIFVLIVGGRYGSIDKATDRSITNGEYIEALAKGLPIYTFVLKIADTLLPSWRENRELTHPQIESPRVFEFVEELKGTSKWVFSFETAKDITDTLRIQWAYLFTDSLEKRALLVQSTIAERLKLRGEALSIALHKGKLWEYRLFVELLTQEIDERASLKHDLELPFSTRTSRHFEDLAEFAGWSADKMAAAQLLLASWNRIAPKINEAFGPPGQAGDVDLIAYTTSRLGAAYQGAFEWALEFHQVSVVSELEKLRQLASHLMDGVIDSFPRNREAFSKIIQGAQAGELSGKQEIIWTVEVPDEIDAAYNAEFDRLKRSYGLG